MRTFPQHIGHQIDGHGRTNVIRVWFKCQAPDRDLFLPQNPERFADQLQEALFLRRVYALHFLEQIEWHPELFADRDESRDVFRETGTAISNPGV